MMIEDKARKCFEWANKLVAVDKDLAVYYFRKAILHLTAASYSEDEICEFAVGIVSPEIVDDLHELSNRLEKRQSVEYGKWSYTMSAHQIM